MAEVTTETPRETKAFADIDHAMGLRMYENMALDDLQALGGWTAQRLCL